MGALTIVNLVGSGRDLLKISPIVAEMEEHSEISSVLVHAGDGLDSTASEVFLRDLPVSPPDVVLCSQMGSSASQAASLVVDVEEILGEVNPNLVLVAGDVTSTLAASLTATKGFAPIARVEAGLRNFDRSLPNEVNRITADAVSDLLYVTEKSAARNLLCEGVPASRLELVGSILVDTLLLNAAEILRSSILSRLSLAPMEYALLAMDAPDASPQNLGLPDLAEALERIQHDIPIVFPVGFETIARLHRMGIWQHFASMPNVNVTEQLGYIDFARLMKGSRFVLTNSGNIQEETTALGVPCLTLLESTERPITVTEGTNALVGTDPRSVISASLRIIDGHPKTGRIPAFWDGNASRRVVNHLLSRADRIKQLSHRVRRDQASVYSPTHVG